LLLELLPTVAKTFLENRRAEEFAAAGGSVAEAAPAAPVAAAPAADGPVTGPTLNAPMGGTVVEIKVKPGDKVKKGQSLLMYEAMKMQNEIEADGEYTVKRILVQQGDVVQSGQPMIEFVDPNAADVEEGPVTGPTLKAPMGGTIIELHVKAGDKVKKGQSLLMYEAMKMQNEIEADGDYTVKRILVKEGEVIAAGQPIVEFVG
jgi:biotin carboxyl carrier protein